MKNDFLKLLAKSNQLRKNKKLLRKEYPEEDKNLVKFLATIEENFHYSEKQEYINLAKEFLENQITAEDFSYSFLAIYEGISKKLGRMIRDESSALINFLSKNRRSDFGRLLLSVYGSCDSFSLDTNVSMSDEKELKNGAQNLLLMLENKFSIEFDETELNEITDTYNANVEVFVTLEDGFPFTIMVGTPENLEDVMYNNDKNFYGPGLPWIIVDKLTKEIIHEAIEAYIDDRPDGYWLKLYHFALDIDIAVLNQLQAQEIERWAQFKLLVGLDDLKAKIKKLDQLEQSTKSDLVASFDQLYKQIDIMGQN